MANVLIHMTIVKKKKKNFLWESEKETEAIRLIEVSVPSKWFWNW